MTTNRSALDYVFHARARKEAMGPTFLHFASPTPPHDTVSIVPTVLREFGKKSHVPAIKLDPDAVPALRQPFSQPRSAMRSHSMPPVPSASFAAKRDVAPRMATPAVTFAEPLERVGLVRSASSISRRSTKMQPSEKKPRVSAIGRIQVPGGIPPSASRPATPRGSDLAGGAAIPPSLPPQSGVITRSLSLKALQSSTTVAAASSSKDPSVTGIAAPEPADPNEYVRTKRLCQLTDEEKQRNRKGKGAQEMLYTAWYEFEGKYPMRHPPDLSGHDQIQYGDIFWYRSPFGVQLWLWTEGADGADDFWRPVVLGVSRDDDGRFLGLNPSQRPSWMTSNWLQKQKKSAAVRVFIFKY